ncbi:unnamed protein product [Staurois parvus]|uniref:Uncharacterized protein n=1 Tax=Staurois parvus TaxID=386267 RepID=A0ABN9CV01_9NEOB|nr:unnamed protein product [Staurois parvus]
MYTDHQGTDDQCALMISVAHQYHLSVSINATCQCPSMPPASAYQCHINATYQCPSELPFSATYQCQSLPPISAAYQCQSVPPISAT